MAGSPGDTRQVAEVGGGHCWLDVKLPAARADLGLLCAEVWQLSCPNHFLACHLLLLGINWFARGFLRDYRTRETKVGQ